MYTHNYVDADCKLEKNYVPKANNLAFTMCVQVYNNNIIMYMYGLYGLWYNDYSTSSRVHVITDHTQAV